MTRRAIIGLALAGAVLGGVAGYWARPTLDLWAYDEVTFVGTTELCPVGWISIEDYPQLKESFDGPFDAYGNRDHDMQMCVWERML